MLEIFINTVCVKTIAMIVITNSIAIKLQACQDFYGFHNLIYF